MAELSPIACESCRQKKRGCDRSLPHCLQCSKTPSQCIYPEVNKRKAERTQEWERLPLRTGDDLAGWYNSRAQSPGDRREDAGESGLPRRRTPQDPELNLRSTRLTPGDSDAPERRSTYLPSPEHGARAEIAGSGMAEALTKSKKHLYF
ncbi:hypothetical protein CC79DRAFT_1321215 [Sarocladium strictum]